jgi:hypothetical protein
MGSFGPDKVVLPSGTTANRPSSPPNGFMRYNTDLYGVEMFTQAGWVIGGGAPGSENNPFSGTGTGLYNAGFTTTGNYWLNSTSTGPFEVRIVHDNGNGWINMTPTMGTMTNALTSGSGSGGSSFLQSPTLDPTSEMNNGTSTQSQAQVYGCPGINGKAYLDLNSSFASDFSITEVRIKMYFVSGGNVICGPYWTNSTTQSSRVQLQGTTTQLNGACANPPNRYTDLVGSGFTVEWYGDISSSNRLLMSWTACGGSFGAQLKSIYVR